MHTVPIAHLASSGPDKWLRNGLSDTVKIFNVAADEVLQPGVPASGNMTGIIAGTVLGPVSTPTYREQFTKVANDPLGISMTFGSVDQMVANSVGSVMNYGAVSFAMLGCYASVGSLGVTTYGIASNFVSNKTGYKVFSISSNILGASIGDGTNVYGLQIGPWGKILDYWLLWHNTTTNEIGLRCRLSEQVLSRTLGSTVTATRFCLGKPVAPSTPSYSTALTHGPYAFFSGANAEYLSTNRVALLDDWWALPN